MNDKITSIEEWKAINEDTITLPSEVSVKIRRLSLFQIIKKDILPAQLTEIIMGLQDVNSEKQLADMLHKKEDMEKIDEAMANLISEMVIEPKLKREDVENLPEDDKYALFGIAFNWESRHQPVKGAGLGKFRTKRQSPMAGSGSKVLGNETKCPN